MVEAIFKGIVTGFIAQDKYYEKFAFYLTVCRFTHYYFQRYLNTNLYVFYEVANSWWPHSYDFFRHWCLGLGG